MKKKRYESFLTKQSHKSSSAYRFRSSTYRQSVQPIMAHQGNACHHGDRQQDHRALWYSSVLYHIDNLSLLMDETVDLLSSPNLTLFILFNMFPSCPLPALSLSSDCYSVILINMVSVQQFKSDFYLQKYIYPACDKKLF